MRLQKFIAECGVASRRKAEELISAGRVKVNGATIREMGSVVDPMKDSVTVNGERLTSPSASEKIYIMLHKPKGYITSAKDQFGRPDVAALVADIPHRLNPVGRLDFDTSGLLLMTNDGDLTYKLTHPKYEVEKVYIARVKGTADEEAIGKLRTGIEIDGKVTAPAKAFIIKQQPGSTSIKITIHEGRNRQVRKMLEALGLPVITLKRIATGTLYLGDLESGKWRHLSKTEVRTLQKMYT